MKLYVTSIFLAFTISYSLNSTTLRKESDESILARADYILTGTVMRIDNVLQQDNTPFHYVSLRVDRLYKNNEEFPVAETHIMIIRQIGGSANGVTLEVDGLAQFVENSQMFLSLNRDPETGYYYVVGSEQGSYYVAGEELINDTRHNGVFFADVDEEGQVRVSSGEVKKISLQDMEEKVNRVMQRRQFQEMEE